MMGMCGRLPWIRIAECAIVGATLSVVTAAAMSLLPVESKVCRARFESYDVDVNGIARWRFRGFGTVAIHSGDAKVLADDGLVLSPRDQSSRPDLHAAWWTGGASTNIILRDPSLSTEDFGAGWPLVCLRGMCGPEFAHPRFRRTTLFLGQEARL